MGRAFDPNRTRRVWGDDCCTAANGRGGSRAPAADTSGRGGEKQSDRLGRRGAKLAPRTAGDATCLHRPQWRRGFVPNSKVKKPGPGPPRGGEGVAPFT